MNADYQDFRYKELTERIIKIFYRVYNKPGYGFLEKIYENAMMIEFKKDGIPAVSQPAIKLFYEDEVIGKYYADILELKRKAFDNLRKSIPARHLPARASQWQAGRSRSREAGGSAGIGPPWRDSFVEFSGLRKPACPNNFSPYFFQVQ